MNDLEITKLCAEAMGRKIVCEWVLLKYNPLHNDAQAMALVKRFHIQIWPEVKRSLREHIYTGWTTFIFGTGTATSTNLNRAICECVAKMQKARV